MTFRCMIRSTASGAGTTYRVYLLCFFLWLRSLSVMGVRCGKGGGCGEPGGGEPLSSLPVSPSSSISRAELLSDSEPCEGSGEPACEAGSDSLPSPPPLVSRETGHTSVSETLGVATLRLLGIGEEAGGVFFSDGLGVTCLMGVEVAAGAWTACVLVSVGWMSVSCVVLLGWGGAVIVGGAREGLAAISRALGGITM